MYNTIEFFKKKGGGGGGKKNWRMERENDIVIIYIVRHTHIHTHIYMEKLNNYNISIYFKFLLHGSNPFYL